MIYFILVPIYIVAIVIAYFITKAIYKSRQRQNKPSWKINSVIWVIVFFGITWDWIPSEIYYAYQCSQLEPIKVYKTPEQWIKENQDLINGKKITFKINSNEDLEVFNDDKYILYNKANLDQDSIFAIGRYKSQPLLRNFYNKEMLIDRKTGEILIESISIVKKIRFDSPPEFRKDQYCNKELGSNINSSFFISDERVNNFFEIEYKLVKKYK